MKHIIITTLLLAGIISGAVAQRNPLDMDRENFFRFGAKGGLNANKITGSAYKDGFNYNYQLGGFLQFNFSKRFGLQPEVNFVQSESQFSSDANNVYNDIFRAGSQRKAKYNSLEIPLLLNLNVGSSKRVKLQVGPAFNGLLKQTVDSLKNNGQLYNKSSFAAIGGLWLQLPLINIGARYKVGLTDINNVDDRETWKNQAFQIFAGFTL